MRIEEIDIKILKEPLLSAIRSNISSHLLMHVQPGKAVNERKASRPLLITATQNSGLEGFALALYHPKLHLADLSQLYVSDQQQFSQVAPLLLDFIEKRLFELGCLVVQHQFASEEGSKAPVEEELVQREWGHKTLINTRYYFDCYAFKPKWFTDHHPLPQGFTIKLWQAIKPEARRKIRRMEEQFAFHPFISPFEDEQYIQEINSLALTYQGEVIGWIVTHTHPDDPNLIRYSSFYVQPEFLAKGVAAPLLQQSILLQQKSPIQWSFFQVTWGFTDQRWARFIDKRLKEWTSRIMHFFRLSKGLR